MAMSTKKKGMLTVSGEWARHLRPWGRRQFWSGERAAVQRMAWDEAHAALHADEVFQGEVFSATTSHLARDRAREFCQSPIDLSSRIC